jgi:hypothetical protein
MVWSGVSHLGVVAALVALVASVEVAAAVVVVAGLVLEVICHPAVVAVVAPAPVAAVDHQPLMRLLRPRLIPPTVVGEVALVARLVRT